jgi:hypothetical protein
MIEPNKNFENELPELYGIRNYQFKKLLDELFNKYKVISKREYDVSMWIGCNLPVSSLVRVSLFEQLTREKLKLNNSELFKGSEQSKLEL